MRSYPPSDRLEVATSDHVAFAFDTLIARLNNPEGKAIRHAHLRALLLSYQGLRN